MMKVVNMCNHCDVSKEMCNTHLLFVMASSFYERWDQIKAIFFNQKTFSTPST